MPRLEVRTYPDEQLAETSEVVGPLGPEDRVFIQNLIDTMFEDDGVGIAAPQVGVKKRIIVVCPKARRGTETVYINPEILAFSDQTEWGVEGCLSVPGVSAEVLRSRAIRLRSTDIHGKTSESEFSGFEARVFQHEIDHLDGILFIDRVGLSERRRIVDDLRGLDRG